MLDMLGTAKNNVYENSGAFIIHANRGGRYLYLALTSLFFLISLAAVVSDIARLISPDRKFSGIGGFVFVGGICAVFGYMSISYLIHLINIKELVLLPNQNKVQVRLERNKKVISEHSADNVALTKDRVEHEEPYRASMKWFTVYDTISKEQLISIRPGNRDTDGIAVEELTEFFQSVMNSEINSGRHSR